MSRPVVALAGILLLAVGVARADGHRLELAGGQRPGVGPVAALLQGGAPAEHDAAAVRLEGAEDQFEDALQ